MDAAARTAKISRQLPHAMMIEPVSGASIGETAMTIMMVAMTRAAAGPLATSRMTARGTAIIAAAPRPCTARAAISQPMVGARLAAIVASVKMPMPIISGRLRPMASAMGP